VRATDREEKVNERARDRERLSEKEEERWVIRIGGSNEQKRNERRADAKHHQGVTKEQQQGRCHNQGGAVSKVVDGDSHERSQNRGQKEEHSLEPLEEKRRGKSEQREGDRERETERGRQREGRCLTC
jgi:hypothetical protein